jgi:hypothetical protein
MSKLNLIGSRQPRRGKLANREGLYRRHLEKPPFFEGKKNRFSVTCVKTGSLETLRFSLCSYLDLRRCLSFAAGEILYRLQNTKNDSRGVRIKFNLLHSTPSGIMALFFPSETAQMRYLLENLFSKIDELPGRASLAEILLLSEQVEEAISCESLF